jgi:hypothetical protein
MEVDMLSIDKAGRRRWGFPIVGIAICLLAGDAVAQSVVSPAVAQVYAGGSVSAIARQSNGQVIVAGFFDHVNGVPRHGLARFNASGSLDMTWNPNPAGYVVSIAIDSSNDIFVGGFFSSIGGQTLASVAKLSSTGTGAADATWNANASNALLGYASISALAFDPVSDMLVVGGTFTAIGGQARNNLARLSTSGVGAADAAWNPDAGTYPYDYVSPLLVDASGNVYAAGSFTTIGGQARSHLAKISGSGAGVVDPTWNPNPGGFIILVEQLAIDPLSGNIYVGGYFTSIGGQPIANLARVSSAGTGAADATWNPVARGEVIGLAVDATGNVYVGGLMGSAGGLNANLLKLSGTGTFGIADQSWNPLGPWATSLNFGIPGIVTSVPIDVLAVDPSGNVYAGGTFTTIGGRTETGFAYLSSSDGAANAAWGSVQTTGTINAMVRDSNSRTVIAGNFQFMGDGVTVRNNIARLTSTGGLDSTWDPEADFQVNTLALDASNNVYVGGLFNSVGGAARDSVAKLSATNGAADATWNPGTDGAVTALALDLTGGYAYIGGSYAHIGGQARSSLAKVSLTGSGSADATWNPSPTPGLYNPVIDALALDATGHLYAGGTFTSIGGQPFSALAQLSTSGAGVANPSWNANPTQSGGPNYTVVDAIVPDTSGNLYVGGNFTSIGGQSRNAIARLTAGASGAADATWNPNAGAGATVGTVTLDGNGHAYLGGDLPSAAYFAGPVFSMGGAIRNNIGRVFTSGSGTADCNWIANADGPVYAIALDASGNVYAGGNFSSIAGTTTYGFAELSGTSAGCRLAIVGVNSGLNPSINVPFTITIQSQDATGAPQDVATDTVAAISVKTGTGTLSGTTSCQINAGDYTCTIPAIAYSVAESGVVLTVSRQSGDTLTSNSSQALTFITEPPPTQLAVLSVNGGANPVAGAAFTALVQTQDANGVPRNVEVDSSASFLISTGTGVLSNDYASAYCQIAAGTNSCTIPGTTYSKADSGVVLTAEAGYGSGYLAGNTQALTIDEPPGGKTLTFVSFGPVISSTPAGLSCTGNSDCTATFPAGSSVTLTYTGTAASMGGWNGDCAGAGTNLSCPLILDTDKVVSINVNLGTTDTSTESFAVQATTTIAGNANLRVDQSQTTLVGHYHGSTVYNQTFAAPFGDPMVQAGVVAADAAIRAAANNSALPVGAPVLAGTSDTLVSSASSFRDLVAVPPPSFTTTTSIGPATVAVGDLGNCVLAPTNCTGPLETVTVAFGYQLINTLIVEYTQTSRTLVTTDTHLLSATYQIGDGSLDSNASLINLVASSGALSPTFASGTLTYIDNVGLNTASITLTPTLSDNTASLTINGLPATSGAASAPIALNYGPNAIIVTVTAQDGATTQAYGVSVIRSDTIFANGFELN